MPITGVLDATSLWSSWTTVGNCAGSPGPLDKRIALGLVSRISAAEAFHEYTRGLTPRRSNERRMFHLAPQSSSAISSSDFVFGRTPLTPVTRSSCETDGAALASRRN